MIQKYLFRFLFQIVMVVSIVEIVLRLIFYQSVGSEKFAIIQTLRRIHQRMLEPKPSDFYNFHFLVRPDSGKQVNKKIAEEAFASNAFEYAPWVEYKNIDFKGKYISSEGLIRTTKPDECIHSISLDTVIIYFFGGSTMYGVNVTDRETIAASFVNLYSKLYPGGPSIKVVNYGISAYHSYNELMLFSNLVYSGHKPGIAVFFDGLNDFLIIKAAKERLPYFYYSLKVAGRNKIDFKALSAKNDSTETLFNLPEGSTDKSICDTLIENYLSNISNIKNLALQNGIKPYFFIQPNPFYNYPNRKNDPICEKGKNVLIERAYPVLEKKADTMQNWYFLGNMLQYEKGYPFIDRFHYSPSMSEKIARQILNRLKDRLIEER